MTIHEALRSACEQTGIVFKDVPADGRWHATDIQDDPHGRGDGRIKLFPDGEGGLVANWKSGDEPQPFFLDDGRKLTDAERLERDRRREDAVRAARAEEKERQADAAKRAAEIWTAAKRAKADYLYLDLKRVKPHGVRVHEGRLIVPVMIDGVLSSLQYIANDGGKRFLPGGRIGGGYHLIGEAQADGVICIAEGYATAATIHEAAGYPVAVAFNAGNLEAVAVSFRKAYPSATLIVCGDDDHSTAGNPGRTKATTAAISAGGVAVFPEFGPDRPAKATDFNDMAALRGLDAVRACVDVGKAMPRKMPATSGSGRENATRTDETGMLTVPEEERPCYRVFDDWFEIREASGKLKPGVYYFGVRESKKTAAPPAMVNQYVCSPLHVEAVTFDNHDGNFGRMLRFKNTLGRWRTWAMPMELLKGSGDELRGELLSMGVEIDSASRQHLERYINSLPPKRQIQCALKVGWCGESYVLPDIVYGPGADEIIYQSGERQHNEYTVGGTLEGWQSEVAERAKGNPLLVLGLSCAFAGPLLARCQMGSGGVHFHGESSTGKTTIVEVACSVWGGRNVMRNWRATANGLEGAATLFNDSLLALDEIKQCPPKDVAEIIYALGNGNGKQRAGRSGRARNLARWRCSLLSSGERTVEAHMAEAGQIAHAGQLVRLLEIPADRTYGAWDDLHGLLSGAAFSDALKVSASKHFGHAGRAFLERLTADKRNFVDLLEKIKRLPGLVPDGTDGQPKRAAARFAVIALAGELATEYGLTGWNEGDAITAAIGALKKWMDERGTSGNDEPRRIIESINDFIDRHGDSRFTDASRTGDDKCINRAGWWSNRPNGDREYWFNAAGMHDALKGFDFTRSLDVLIRAGILRTGRDDKGGKRAVRRWACGRTQAVYPICLDSANKTDVAREEEPNNEY